MSFLDLQFGDEMYVCMYVCKGRCIRSTLGLLRVPSWPIIWYIVCTIDGPYVDLIAILIWALLGSYQGLLWPKTLQKRILQEDLLRPRIRPLASPWRPTGATYCGRPHCIDGLTTIEPAVPAMDPFVRFFFDFSEQRLCGAQGFKVLFKASSWQY